MLKLGTRYYVPDLARWTQPDPIPGRPHDPMTLNPYAYVGGNPTNATDPSGRCISCWNILGGAATAAVEEGWEVNKALIGVAGDVTQEGWEINKNIMGATQHAAQFVVEKVGPTAATCAFWGSYVVGGAWDANWILTTFSAWGWFVVGCVGGVVAGEALP